MKFDGKHFDEEDLEPAFRQAATGAPRAENPDYLHDPMWWATSFVDALDDEPSLKEAAGLAVGRLMQDDDPTVRDFAIELQFNKKIAPAAQVIAAMKKLEQEDILQLDDRLTQLASSLRALARQKKLAYDPVLRDFASRPDVGRALLGVYFRLDLEWAAGHLETLLGTTPGEVETRIAVGTAGLTRAELEALDRAIGPALSSLPPSTSAAVRTGLDAALAAAS